ncbi:MAG: hypothetical protein KGI45_02350 [Patescibacteria group bacterium]|nr:hypothetical protein [Patescibacteria group bacterium]MDE1966892.1 hypothetical protein [Patescibacteria group bacterium]
MTATQKRLLWVAGVGFGIIVIVGVILHASAAIANAKASSPAAAASVASTMVPSIKTVTVGTVWYDPNELNLRLNIWGNPNVNAGRGVRWQVRARYSNGICEVRDMQPVDALRPVFIHFQSRSGNTELTGIDYRVTPGQAVQSCPFVFHFEQPSS